MTPKLKTLTIEVSFVDTVTELVRIKVPASLKEEEIRKAMTKANKICFDKDIYGSSGLCAETLFEEVQKAHPSWYYEVIKPDWKWTDLYG